MLGAWSNNVVSMQTPISFIVNVFKVSNVKVMDVWNVKVISIEKSGGGVERLSHHIRSFGSANLLQRFDFTIKFD